MSSTCLVGSGLRKPLPRLGKNMHLGQLHATRQLGVRRAAITKSAAVCCFDSLDRNHPYRHTCIGRLHPGLL
jgi:hypothetical protein